MKKLTLFIVISLLSTGLFAQILTPVKWSYAAKKINKTEAVLLLKATIDNGWHIYSTQQKDGGPVKTAVTFTPSKDYALNGAIAEPKPVTKFENAFKMNVSYFEKSVVFQQKIKLKKDQASIKGKLEYMVCNDKQCLPPEDVDFSIPVK
ncbi:protein-disulfide reductase DsbD domain-containing protein [Mucilaginibacter arboris]|uniref:Sugar transporter n=1 Tax=Mucilaginibacter arboris TaxID=2682090 RepID=A0A7K1SSE9_9SPHI|nr:protein-disulfide reductase DsbD domain-containing protein [Mucilaginibacter arboris]MVN20239.1 sugar transporter [Mucilaginibacter arboris]